MEAVGKTAGAEVRASPGRIHPRARIVTIPSTFSVTTGPDRVGGHRSTRPDGQHPESPDAGRCLDQRVELETFRVSNTHLRAQLATLLVIEQAQGVPIAATRLPPTRSPPCCDAGPPRPTSRSAKSVATGRDHPPPPLTGTTPAADRSTTSAALDHLMTRLMDDHCARAESATSITVGGRPPTVVAQRSRSSNREPDS